MKNLRLVDSFRRAVKGIKNAFLREYHIRVAFFWCLLCFCTVWCLADTSRVACSCDVFFIGGVLEMINSALEKLADAVHPDWSEQVGVCQGF